MGRKLFCGEGGCRAHNTSAGKCSEIVAYGEVVIFVDSVVCRLVLPGVSEVIRFIENDRGIWGGGWDGDSWRASYTIVH